MLDRLLQEAADAYNIGDRRLGVNLLNYISGGLNDPEIKNILRSWVGKHAIIGEIAFTLGYPANSFIIQDIIEYYCEGSYQVLQNTKKILDEVPAQVITTYLLPMLWDRGRTNTSWLDDAYGCCSLLFELKSTECSVQCAPTLAIVLEEGSALADSSLVSRILDVLRRIKPGKMMYYIPIFYRILESNASPDVLIMISSFIEEYFTKYHLRIYRLIKLK